MDELFLQSGCGFESYFLMFSGGIARYQLVKWVKSLHENKKSEVHFVINVFDRNECKTPHRHSFSIINICYGKMDFRFFHFHVTKYPPLLES